MMNKKQPSSFNNSVDGPNQLDVTYAPAPMTLPCATHVAHFLVKVPNHETR
ncbi:hypothetical protein PINS_up006434 [Pythium insidiosum]|nr:hypothetical protein PINS_up006434 [Pythium insidiosum]